MKRNLSVTLVIFLSSISLSLAQGGESTGKYVFVISKVNYLKAINDAVSGAGESGLNISEVRVIFCGESVKAFAEKNPIIEKALTLKSVQLYACGLSLEQMKVDPKALPSAVKTVRNGILEAMRLDEAGYKKFDL